MSRRILGIIAGITILLMVLPPIFDTFDKWDKTPEIPVSGHNTETTLSMMAVGVGMGLTVAWSAVLLLQWLAEIFAPRMLTTQAVARAGVRATEYLLLLFSPPWAFASLRI
jgi:hypothetical protein